MSFDDPFSNLFHTLRHGDKLVEELLQGGGSTRIEQMAAQAGLNRETVSDRRFWTGAAIGAAVVLIAAAVRNSRTPVAAEPFANGGDRSKSDKRW